MENGFDQQAKERGEVTISQEKEREIWRHFIGVLIDRYTPLTGEIKMNSFILMLDYRFGHLFIEHEDEFKMIIQSLRDAQHQTKEGLLNLLCDPLQHLREKCYLDYSSFERELRIAHQNQSGYTPLTPDNVVSYEVRDDTAFVHIQPAYSVPDKLLAITAGMRALAQALNTPKLSKITSVGAQSWLFKNRSKRIKKLGFTKDSNDELSAYTSVEQFKNRWLDDSVNSNPDSLPITSESPAP